MPDDRNLSMDKTTLPEPAVRTQQGGGQEAGRSAGPGFQGRGSANGFTGGLLHAGQVLVLAAAVLLWWAGSATAPRGAVPSPSETVFALVSVAATAGFWEAVRATLETFILGIVICIVLGVPAGLLIGANRTATQSTRLAFDFLRTIPPIAVLPVVLLLFGSTPTMVLVMVVLGTIWPILIQSVYAAQQAEPQLNDMARAFQIAGSWRLSRIFIPGALPFVMTGLRVGTSICLLLTLSGELLGGAPGIGFEIQNAMNSADNPRMYAYVTVAAVLGVLVNSGFWLTQRRILHWHPSFREGGK